jgi:multiple sugar transport system substrate-binding protein
MGIRFRRASALAFVAALAVGISACGGSSTSTSSSSSNKKISGTVSLWDYEYKSFPKYTKAANQLDHEFEHLHPGVKVERIAQPFESYEAHVQSAFAAHETPDLMLFAPGAAGVLHFKEALEELNPHISPELQKETVLWEAVTPGYTTTGPHYAIPMGISGNQLYYNKADFAKAGMSREFKPKNWTEFAAAVAKLKAAGIPPFTGENKEGYENEFWIDWGWQGQNTYQQAVELGAGKIPWTSPLVEKALAPEFEMYKKGYYPSNTFSKALFTEGLPLFGEGKGAMGYGFNAVIGYWGEYNEKLGEKNVGILTPPGSEKLLLEPNDVIAMPKDAKNKEAAWAFLEFLASAHAWKVQIEAGGALPTRKDVPIPASLPVQAHEIMHYVDSGETQLSTHDMFPGPVGLYGPFKGQISEALQGRKSLKEALKVTQEAAEKVHE